MTRIEPTPAQLADATLTEPFTGEVAFTDRLGLLLGDDLGGTDQARLATAMRTALIRSQIQPLPADQHRLLCTPLHPVVFPGRHAPDVALANNDRQIVWVIEGKGRTTDTQWTPLSSLRRQPYQDTAWAGFIAEHAVAPYDPVWDQPHPYGQPCGCRLQKDLRSRGHVNALHQGDGYLAFADWIPEGYAVHPDAVWTALLPSPYAVWDWRQNLLTTDMWQLARIRAFHDHLIDIARSGQLQFTQWEQYLLTHFAIGMQDYYDLTTPPAYADDEWLTYHQPVDAQPFVPDEGTKARFNLAAWQAEPLDITRFRAFSVLVHGAIAEDDGYEEYLDRHAQWRSTSGYQNHLAHLAHLQSADRDQGQGDQAERGNDRAQLAKDVAKAGALFAFTAFLDHRENVKARRAARASGPQRAMDAIASYVVDDRPKWQREADELRRLQLKEARRRNKSWW